MPWPLVFATGKRLAVFPRHKTTMHVQPRTKPAPSRLTHAWVTRRPALELMVVGMLMLLFCAMPSVLSAQEVSQAARSDPGIVGQWPARVDESRRTEFGAASRPAADGAEPGTGHPADDHQLRTDHRRTWSVAPALGTQQLPPSQVITSLALFMTMLIMAPVWRDVYDQSIGPYTDPHSDMTMEEAWQAGSLPIKRFMARQIEAAGNTDDVHLFYRYLPPDTLAPKTFDDVPLQVLLPAYMLSELKIAFLIGFQIYLPFLILDIVVASVTISMGMLMLPPVMISLPFKLMLFVLVDGWRLVVGMLLESFGPLY